MQTYLITDRAGPYIAGRFVAGIEPSPDGARRISLSDSAAAYELGLGSIAIERARDTEASPAVKTRKGEAKVPEAE